MNKWTISVTGMYHTTSDVQQLACTFVAILKFNESSVASMSFDKGSSENFFPEKKPDFASCGSPASSPEPDTVGAAAVPPFCSDCVLAASPGDCTRTFLVFLVAAATGSTCSPVLCRLRAFPLPCGGKHAGRGCAGGRGGSKRS